MKTSVIVLSLLVAVLGAAVWQKTRSSQAALQSAGARLNAVSNQFDEVKMKLNHQEQLALATQTKVVKRTEELAAVSNALENVRAELSRVRTEMTAERVKLQAALDGNSKSEARLNEANRANTRLMEEIAALHLRLDQMTNTLAHQQAELGELMNDQELLKAQKAELTMQWNDPAAVNSRLHDLQRAARAQNSAKNSVKAPLVMQADGSVGLASP
jgi:chromosome segregation ATPase